MSAINQTSPIRPAATRRRRTPRAGWAGRSGRGRALAPALAAALFAALFADRAQTRAASPSEPSDAPALASVVGAPRTVTIGEGDTLLDVAERNRLGFERVARLNPDLDVWLPPTGARVRIPTFHVLPDTPHEGLVVNLPELQLYDYAVDRERPEVFALAIGDELDPSLVGRFQIGAKRADPVWHVPASIRAEKPELPAAVPPGPDNPLGPYWLTIGQTSYGIHGTNNRWSIGREATHGCLRLYNDEVERLYARTRTGTRIEIVYQTVKVGRRDGVVYVEAHPDRYRRDPDRLARALETLAAHGLADPDTASLVRQVVEAARGEPVAIAVLPD